MCAFGCGKSAQTEAKLFSLTMERNNAVGPCNKYRVKIESDGKVTADRSCILFVECDGSESNGISFEKRNCPRNESETVEKQLSAEEIEELFVEINKSNFFSFQDDYSSGSKNCSQTSTDSPNVVLSVKTDEKAKTIMHYHGCWVNKWLIQKNALQPLISLETKIDKTVGTESWVAGRK